MFLSHSLRSIEYRMRFLIHHFLSLSAFILSLIIIENKEYTDKAKHFV